VNVWVCCRSHTSQREIILQVVKQGESIWFRAISSLDWKLSIIVTWGLKCLGQVLQSCNGFYKVWGVNWIRLSRVNWGWSVVRVCVFVCTRVCVFVLCVCVCVSVCLCMCVCARARAWVCLYVWNVGNRRNSSGFDYTLIIQSPPYPTHTPPPTPRHSLQSKIATKLSTFFYHSTITAWRSFLSENLHFTPTRSSTFYHMWLGWDLVKWLESCASIPIITSSNPSGGSELTFRSDLLLTALREVVVRERSLSLPVCRVTRVTHCALSA
jgi:hypothetical protein